MSLLWTFVSNFLKIFQRFDLSVSWWGFGILHWIAVRVRIDACADCNFNLSDYRIYLWYDDVSLEKLQNRIQGSSLCFTCIHQPYLSLGLPWIFSIPQMSVSYWILVIELLVSRNWFGVFLTLDKYMANFDIHCFGNGTHLYFWVSFRISHSYQHSFVFRNMALVSCFPISSHGIMFALIELCRKVLHLVWNR